MNLNEIKIQEIIDGNVNIITLATGILLLLIYTSPERKILLKYIEQLGEDISIFFHNKIKNYIHKIEVSNSLSNLNDEESENIYIDKTIENDISNLPNIFVNLKIKENQSTKLISYVPVNVEHVVTPTTKFNKGKVISKINHNKFHSIIENQEDSDKESKSSYILTDIKFNHEGENLVQMINITNESNKNDENEENEIKEEIENKYPHEKGIEKNTIDVLNNYDNEQDYKKKYSSNESISFNFKNSTKNILDDSERYIINNDFDENHYNINSLRETKNLSIREPHFQNKFQSNNTIMEWDENHLKFGGESKFYSKKKFSNNFTLKSLMEKNKNKNSKIPLRSRLKKDYDPLVDENNFYSSKAKEEYLVLMDNRIKVLEEEINNLQSENHHLNENRLKNLEEINIIKTKNYELKNELEMQVIKVNDYIKYQELAVNLEDEVLDLRKENNLKEVTIETLYSELRKEQKEKIEEVNKLKSLLEENNQTLQQFEIIKKENQSLKEKLKDLNSNKTLAEELFEANKRYKKLSKDYENIIKEKKKLDSKIELIEHEAKLSKDKIFQLKSTLIDKENEISELKYNSLIKNSKKLFSNSKYKTVSSKSSISNEVNKNNQNKDSPKSTKKLTSDNYKYLVGYMKIAELQNKIISQKNLFDKPIIEETKEILESNESLNISNSSNYDSSKTLLQIENSDEYNKLNIIEVLDSKENCNQNEDDNYNNLQLNQSSNNNTIEKEVKKSNRIKSISFNLDQIDKKSNKNSFLVKKNDMFKSINDKVNNLSLSTDNNNSNFNEIIIDDRIHSNIETERNISFRIDNNVKLSKLRDSLTVQKYSIENELRQNIKDLNEELTKKEYLIIELNAQLNQMSVKEEGYKNKIFTLEEEIKNNFAYLQNFKKLLYENVNFTNVLLEEKSNNFQNQIKQINCDKLIKDTDVDKKYSEIINGQEKIVFNNSLLTICYESYISYLMYDENNLKNFLYDKLSQQNVSDNLNNYLDNQSNGQNLIIKPRNFDEINLEVLLLQFKEICTKNELKFQEKQNIIDRLQQEKYQEKVEFSYKNFKLQQKIIELSKNFKALKLLFDKLNNKN